MMLKVVVEKAQPGWDWRHPGYLELCERLRHVALQQSLRKGQKTWGVSQKNIRHRPEP